MRNHGTDAVSTSGIYWQEKGPFTQPLRTPKTVLWRRELRTTPLRSMAPCARVFTSEAGEFAIHSTMQIIQIQDLERPQQKIPISKRSGLKFNGDSNNG